MEVEILGSVWADLDLGTEALFGHLVREDVHVAGVCKGDVFVEYSELSWLQKRLLVLNSGVVVVVPVVLCDVESS